MRRGNTYELKVSLSNASLEPLSMDTVVKVEFTFGPVRKIYPESVKYDQDTKEFILTLNQVDTFKLETAVDYQARVKFSDGSVAATDIYRDYVLNSLSKEVL